MGDDSVAATRCKGEGDVDFPLSLMKKRGKRGLESFGKELPKAWGALEVGGVVI